MAENDDHIRIPCCPTMTGLQEALRQVAVSALRHVGAGRSAGRAPFLHHLQDRLSGRADPRPAARAVSGGDDHRAAAPVPWASAWTRPARPCRWACPSAACPRACTIPFAAITNFADPEVRFGLQFEVAVPEPVKARSFRAAEEGRRARPPA